MARPLFSDQDPRDVLLVQPVIRHPREAHLHSPAFNRYFHSMQRLAAETGFYSLVTRGVPSPPTHLLSLAAYLRARHVSVAVADLNLQYLATEKEPEDELIDRLTSTKPRILGISAMESYLLDAALRLVHAARQVAPDLFIVLGGVNATAIDAHILQTGKVDAVVRGEGEATLADLCQAVLKQRSLAGVAGLSWRQGERVVRNPDRPLLDLTTLPLPARDLYPLEQIYALNGGVDAVYGSRGCPHQCLFCHGPAFWKGHWRGRRPDHVVQELTHIANTGGRVVFLYDMNFGHDRRWALAIADGIVNADLGLIWGCELRVDQMLDRPFLEAIHRAGCRSAFVGIESLDPGSLAAVDKGYGARQLEEALENAIQIGIAVEATVMIGLPADSAAAIRGTTDAAIRLFEEDRLRLVHYFLCVPWPGTALGGSPERYGIDVACTDPGHMITAPSVPLASTRHLSAREVFDLWEEGVARLCEAALQKLMLHRLRKSFGAGAHSMSG